MAFQYLLSGDSPSTPISFYIYQEQSRDKNRVGVRFKIDWVINSGTYNKSINLFQLFINNTLHANALEIKGKNPSTGSGSFYLPQNGYIWFDVGYADTHLNGVRFRFSSAGNVIWDIGYDSQIYIPAAVIPSTIASSMDFNISGNSNNYKMIINDLSNLKYTYQVDIWVDDVVVTSYLDIRDKTTNIYFGPNEMKTIYTTLKNKKNGQVRMNLQTFYVGNYVGVTEKRGTITIVNSNPTLSGFDYDDTNSVTVGVTGNSKYLVANLSKIKITSNTGVAKNYATIVQYEVNAGGKFYTSKTNVIYIDTLSETLDVEVRVVDSRGFVGNFIKRLEVNPYGYPKISHFSMKRLNDLEKQTYVTLTATYDSKIPIADNQRIKSVVLEYKSTSGYDSSQSVNITDKATLNNGSLTMKDVQVIDFNNEQSFNMKIIITDAYNQTAFSQYILPTGMPLLSIEKDHIGIGKLPNAKFLLDIGGSVNMAEPLYFDETNKVDSSGSSLYINDNKIIDFSNPNFMIFRGVLSESSNLNSFKNFGIYYTNSNAIAQKVQNMPTPKAGVLEVLRWSNGSDCIQRYTPYSGDVIYTRRYYDYETSWSNWTRYQQGKNVVLYNSVSSGNAVLNGTVKVNLSDSWWNYDYLVIYIANNNTNERTSVMLFPNINHECFYNLYILTSYHATGLVSLTDNGSTIGFTVKEVVGWNTNEVRLVKVIGIQL